MNGTDTPRGFQAHFCPGATDAPALEVDVLVGNALAMAIGDACTPTSTGGITRAATVATDLIAGVCDGFKYTDSAGLIQWSPYLAVSTAARMTLLWNPLQLYRVQGSGAATALSQTQVWNTADTVDTAPSAVLNCSLQGLDITTFNTTNTLGWKILGYPKGGGNLGGSDATGNISRIGDTYPVYIVIANRRFLGNQTAGV